jgi:hypothetical protein
MREVELSVHVPLDIPWHRLITKDVVDGAVAERGVVVCCINTISVVCQRSDKRRCALAAGSR